MNVRAKFRYTGYESSLGSRQNRETGKSEEFELRTLTLRPVYGNGDPNHENTKFYAWTPSGEIKLGCVNPEAWAAFEIGKEYYVDFSEANVTPVEK